MRSGPQWFDVGNSPIIAATPLASPLNIQSFDFHERSPFVTRILTRNLHPHHPHRRARTAGFPSPTTCSATPPAATCSAGPRTSAWACGPSCSAARSSSSCRTHGGLRADDGSPIALGYHTGHWEVGLLVKAAAEEFRRRGGDPVRRGRHRPVRRPHPGHARACSTACRTATTRRWSCAG